MIGKMFSLLIESEPCLVAIKTTPLKCKKISLGKLVIAEFNNNDNTV